MADLQKMVGEKIRNSRTRLAITQQQLAEAADFSSAQIISQIEKGEREVKAVELFKLAKALKTDITQLLSMEPAISNTLVFWRKASTTPPAKTRFPPKQFRSIPWFMRMQRFWPEQLARRLISATARLRLCRACLKTNTESKSGIKILGRTALQPPAKDHLGRLF
jgi:transcriptional regulator with XRE-family HTH domain